jgi:hypothetical protein
MFGFAWLTLRQAQEALRTGRLDEALRLLEQPAVRNHRKASTLMLDLGRAHVERGERHLQREDTPAAWADLLAAEKLGTAVRAGDRLRQSLAALGVTEARAMLQAGNLVGAEEVVTRLRQRGVHAPELGVLEEGLRDWLRSRELVARGDFALAVEAAAQAGRLLGVNRRLEEFRADLARHQSIFPDLLVRLHDGGRREAWQEVVELAEQVLAAAPQHAEARTLRNRAWRALEPATAPHPGPDGDEVSTETAPPRFFLWIDGVGGYLVCLGNRLTFGQALPGARVDVPLVADVSRLHATLTRDAEGYVVEAVRPILVNGATVTRALLQPGDRVTLGSSCQFQFLLPVPGSGSARLDLVSGHRLPTSVEGVLLMAETLVMGGSPQSHVVIPDRDKPIVLFRHRDGLGLRATAPMLVNGMKCNGRTMLPPDASVSGDDISFAIESAT